MFAFATPGFAQSYSAGYGTGNLIDSASREIERHLRIFRDGCATADYSRCVDRSRSKLHFGLRLFAAEFPSAQSAHSKLR